MSRSLFLARKLCLCLFLNLFVNQSPVDWFVNWRLLRSREFPTLLDHPHVWNFWLMRWNRIYRPLWSRPNVVYMPSLSAMTTNVLRTASQNFSYAIVYPCFRSRSDIDVRIGKEHILFCRKVWNSTFLRSDKSPRKKIVEFTIQSHRAIPSFPSASPTAIYWVRITCG